MRRTLLAMVLVVILAACGGSDGGKQATATTKAATSTTLATANSTATTIRVPTAREFIAGFKRAGLPIGKVRCYTEATDPNHLLGRPGGYTEKCDWADKRYPQYGDTKDFDYTLTGGSIETFEKPGGAVARAEYLRAFEGPTALNPGYTFVPKDAIWVLRIDSELTRKQANVYLKAMLAQL
jgi:hypothetical protein